MGPDDRRVWQAALKTGKLEYDRFEYDVRLGGRGADQVPDGHDLKVLYLSLLKKRVDVVAWRGKVPTLIEVKGVASFSALGQCLGYSWLWKKEMPTSNDVGMLCVCAAVDPDLRPVFDAYGVKLLVLPSDVGAEILTRVPRL